MTEKKKTPMEVQYETLKKEAGESLLFFRVGDFYEMFGEDAENAADILEISLTSRNKKAENPVAMCGIPYHAADRYIAKLMRAGKKVAIAEQVTQPSEKGIVERKIINIVTPGTTFSQNVLEAKQPNYMAGFWNTSECTSVCFADLSTGNAWVQDFETPEEATKEIMKLDVVELVITPEQFRAFSSLFSYFPGSTTRHFIPDQGERFIKDFFQVKTLKPFGIEKNISAQSAVSLLFSFISETQNQTLEHCSGVSYKNCSDRLSLDLDTVRNLELFYASDGSKKNGLFSHIDKTKTAMGGRKLQEDMLSPFSQKQAIDSRLQTIDEFIQNPNVQQSIEKTLSQVADIERILARIATSRAIPRDYILLENSLQALQDLLSEHEENPDSEWGKWKTKLKKYF